MSREVERLELRDVIVVLPGILGSTLIRDGQEIWAPSAGAVWKAIRSFGASIQCLTLPVDLGDDHPGDGVEALALMPDLHVLPGILSANIGYDRLLAWLMQRFKLVLADPKDFATPGNLLPFAYDWRLSCRYNAPRLKQVVEPALERWRALDNANRDARLIFICHSMGGLVARWYLEQEGGAAHTCKLITIGTPHRGAVAALQQLVNGVEKTVGPLRLELTRFARSLPSAHQLLPQYACLETDAGLTPITARLRQQPLDTAVPNWQRQLAGSVAEALDQELETLPALMRGQQRLPQAAQELLAALVWAYGQGFPVQEWALAATALSPIGTAYGRQRSSPISGPISGLTRWMGAQRGSIACGSCRRATRRSCRSWPTASVPMDRCSAKLESSQPPGRAFEKAWPYCCPCCKSTVIASFPWPKTWRVSISRRCGSSGRSRIPS